MLSFSCILCIEKRSQNSHFRLNFFSFSIFIIQFRPFFSSTKKWVPATEGLQNKTKFFISAPHRVSDAVAKHDELGETDERDSFRVSSRCFCVKEGSFALCDEESATTALSSTDRCGCWKRVQSLGWRQEQQEKNRFEEDHDHRCWADCHWTGN